MAIRIHGRLNVVVGETELDLQRVATGSDQERRARMPEIVEPDRAAGQRRLDSGREHALAKQVVADCVAAVSRHGFDEVMR